MLSQLHIVRLENGSCSCRKLRGGGNQEKLETQLDGTLRLEAWLFLSSWGCPSLIMHADMRHDMHDDKGSERSGPSYCFPFSSVYAHARKPKGQSTTALAGCWR